MNLDGIEKIGALIQSSIKEAKEEIEHKIENFEKRSDSTHDKILQETKKINGRVAKLERDKIVRDTQLRLIKWGLVTVAGVMTAWVTQHILTVM